MYQKLTKLSFYFLYFSIPFLMFACQKKSIIFQNRASIAAEIWLTNPDKSALFSKQKENIKPVQRVNELPLIEIDTSQKFQVMDGFGYSLTGGSAWHIHQMNPKTRATLLQEFFGQNEGQIGVSYLRISIGASDLDEKPFSYNDLAIGETDMEMKKFDIAPDKLHLIPILKEILKINPSLKIMASPWSPPAWMKTNQDTRGGSLKPEFYPAYAKYLVKYIQTMQSEGIGIDAITVQNEPLHPGNNPSLLMQAEEQTEFIKNHLGPTFESENIKTKIIIYDHNADRPDYPISILNDEKARKYIDGSAFHLYGGEINALAKVHQAHPDKNLYFTEQWIGAPGNFAGDIPWHIKELIIGASRNWCKTVLEWNLSSNETLTPHTHRGGCDRCLGAITIKGNEVIRNPAYYIIAHAAKFVRPHSYRIASVLVDKLPNVAFKTPENKIVLIILNDSQITQSFQMAIHGKIFTATLLAGAVGTYVWVID